MKLKLTFTAIAMALATVSAAAIAQSPAAGSYIRPVAPAQKADLAPTAVSTAIKVAFSKLPQPMVVDEVLVTPVKGLFEVRVGRNIIYSDDKAEYLFQGGILQASTGRNITQERMLKLNTLDFFKLPFDDSVKIVKGNGSRKLAIFEDPNCGYCKRLESEMKSLKDVTIYVFLYPILGQDSVEKTRDIWCSKDRADAWDSWMVDGKKPAAAAKDCDTSAITRVGAMARELDVRGTPGLVFEDGSRNPGAMSLDQLTQKLSEAAKQKSK